jgi:tripartite ATP-independent transporter DctM subunit
MRLRGDQIRDGAILLSPLSHREDLVDRILLGVVGGMLVLEVVLVLGTVVARSVFNHGLVWTFELEHLDIAVLAFVGMPVAFRRNQLIGVVAVLERLPITWRRLFEAVGDCAVLVTAAAVAWSSLPLLVVGWQERSPVLGIQQTWFYAPLTVGSAVIVVFALERLLKRGMRTAAYGSIATTVLVASLWLAQATVGEAIAIPTMVLLFVAALLIGIQIGFVLLLVALAYLVTSGNAGLLAVPLQMQDIQQNFLLLAIPFFILAGELMTHGGLTRPMAECFGAFVGHLRGGFLYAVIISMYVFSGISGSKIADVAAVGGAMRETLRERGYPPAECVAVVSSAAVMGETIPPSIGMLVLASISTLSVGALFLAGLFPAAAIGVFLMLLVYVRARTLGMPRSQLPPLRVRLRTIPLAVPALMVPGILAFGILSGIATPTEVSSFAVAYAVAVSVCLYRSVTWSSLSRVVVDASCTSAMILFLLASASAFSWTITLARIPDAIASFLSVVSSSPAIFVIVAILMLIVMGAILEGLPALLIMAPLLLPVAVRFGVDPLQFGILLVFAMGFGAFLPPIGIGAYVAASLFGVSIEATMRSMLPYVAVLMFGIVLIALIPSISLWLPHRFHFGT